MSKKNIIVEQALQKVASHHNITVDEVRKEINLAILVGLCNTDMAVQSQWRKTVRTGELPTPEDLILRLSKIAAKR